MEPVLPGFKDRESLVGMSNDQLTALCSEMREEIINTVALNGGHLGSSLGVVELSVALHLVFETPRDKILWDVGHQAYAHKMLTGRLDRFKTLRRRGGLSGFPKRSESPHDAFGVGHASTAISAALGFAAARDMRGDDNSVIAVVGDGAMTGGLAFEGMNNAGQLNSDLIVVLNDNKMSISPNVGALAKYLTRITSGRHYNRIEGKVWKLLGIGPFGEKAQILATRIKMGLKHLLVPTILFEQLGLKYFGPIDGHDLPLMVQTLRAVRKLGGPVLVHVLTRKGKGYSFAEQDSPRYHGVGSFDKGEGLNLIKPKIPSYTSVFGQTIVEMARDNEKVCAITAAMPDGTGLETLKDTFPERFFDVGIAEEHAVTFAAGLACEGQRPVVALYSTFLQRTVDQIIHDVALQKLPVVFAVDRGGIVGEDGPTHHGVFDLSFLRMVPGMVLMAPKDENELRRMLVTAMNREDGPSAVRYPRGAGLGVKLDDPALPIEIGEAEILQDGEHVCLLAVGATVMSAVEAAGELARLGIGVTVVNARFVKPIDEKVLADVWGRHRLIVTIEENSVQGGFGSAVLEWAATAGRTTETPVMNLGIPDDFQEHATRAELLETIGLSAHSICERVARELESQGRSRRTMDAS